MAKKLDPLLKLVQLVEGFTKAYSKPSYWSNTLKPLPIESYLDFLVASTIFALYVSWKSYKDPNTSEYQKKQEIRYIKSLVPGLGGKRHPGAATLREKDIFITLVSPLVKEKDYYSEYKQLRKTKEYEVSKKEVLGRIVRDFASKRVLFFSVDPGFEKKLKRLDWRKLTTPTKFNNHLIAYLVGYSHPDSAKVLKSRTKQRLKR